MVQNIALIPPLSHPPGQAIGWGNGWSWVRSIFLWVVCWGGTEAVWWDHPQCCPHQAYGHHQTACWSGRTHHASKLPRMLTDTSTVKHWASSYFLCWRVTWDYYSPQRETPEVFMSSNLFQVIHKQLADTITYTGFFHLLHYYSTCELALHHQQH